MRSADRPVLLVDDEPQILMSMGVLLRGAGIKSVLAVDDSRKVLPLLDEQGVSLIVLDLTMPYLSGAELLGAITTTHPETPVIVVTATDDLETAVECMKKGALDYLVKPVDKNRLLASVKRSLEISALKAEVSSLKEYLLTDTTGQDPAFAAFRTASKKMDALFKYARAISRSPNPVLITGETGTGKELFAQAIHTLSGRTGEFVAVNVAGLDNTMFSDTLFGHRKGAFTGADQSREGFIARAAGGTLFLDEIGDLPEQSQVKLLRLLQEQTYLPLGSDVHKVCEARVITATNYDIRGLLNEGKFRKDLYYRLFSHHVHLPPLRERTEDIPLLLKQFLEEASSALGKAVPAYPRELVTLLSIYQFPGNVRELQAIVHDAVARHQSGVLSMERFREVIQLEQEAMPLSLPELDRASQLLEELFGRFPSLKEAEDYLIAEALRLANNNQGIASSMLGISRQALNKRLLRSS